MPRTTHNPWLSRYALLTAIASLALIGLGGLVTSKGAGMAVPDWPTTYGYNMFLFPVSYWVGGIFYEHTHRLFASLVGLLTIILAIWLTLRESRRALRWMGWIAVGLVSVQGLLGGLRVTLYQDELGIVHATLAQIFFVWVSAIALFTSRWWQRLPAKPEWQVPKGVVSITLLMTGLVLAQLILGASMRHQHAGLAVPDFPTAYGGLWPETDSESLAVYNQHRLDYRDYGPVTAFQIHLHMAHRVGALAITALAAWLLWWLPRRLGRGHPMLPLSRVWAAVIGLQFALGVATIWSRKAADVATMHVVLGALSLVGVVTMALVARRYRPVPYAVQGAVAGPRENRRPAVFPSDGTGPDDVAIESPKQA